MLEILYEDTHLIVLNKPPGLLSQGESTGDENLVDLLRKYVGRNYIGLVHRLDRNTSGAMVIAKRSKSAQRLSDCLKDGSLKRSYLAFLEGNVKTSENWRDWILKDENKNKSSVCANQHIFRKNKNPLSKTAILKIQPLSKTLAPQEITLARFELETGRSHQIRAQSSFHGHPLVGDHKYGSKVSFGRPALHSWEISFPHPMNEVTPTDGEKKILSFRAPLTHDLIELAKKTGVSLGFLEKAL